MGERKLWLCTAALATALALTGCGSTDTVEGEPPMEGDEAAMTEEGAEATESESEAMAEGESEAMAEGEAEGEGEGEGEGEAMAEAPAEDPNTISLWVDLEGDKPVVKAGDQQMDATPEVNKDLVALIKSKKEEIKAAGGTPMVKISAPKNVGFDEVVAPVLRASYRAGFKTESVLYTPR